MEKRINKKIDMWITDFKDNIKEKALDLGMLSDTNLIKLVQYIFDYERLSLSKDDFVKRKRVKNFIVLSDRCCAKRANNEQCTRRRKEGSEYCGTHLKGTPHGIHDINIPVKQIEKIEVWAQEIKGIIYYIDNNNNVYHPEDIMKNVNNPKIIAKYFKNDETYTIPELNL
jgi:hypothetical protein